LKLARLIEENQVELALLDSLDMGKPISGALAVDLPVAIQTMEYFAEAIDKMYDQVAPTDRGSLGMITREPLGVIGAVVPWNFPFMLAIWKLAPALAAGNSIVIKPAEQSPLSALKLAELAAEAGIPGGVVNVLPGFGPTAGAALGRHMDVDALTFTGSGEVGRLFMHYSAESNMKQVSLELGGKTPQIVFEDAPPLDVLVEAVAEGIFFNQGEVCSAGSRLLVHKSRRDELVDALIGAAKERKAADPLDPETQTGAVVEKVHLERIMDYVRIGKEEGVRILVGGNQTRHDTGGFYVEPTIMDGVQPDMRVAQEEIFGPVLAVMEFDDIQEAVQIANGTRFGLAAAVWTNDLTTAHTVARDLRAGTVWVNCFDACDITMPFGGYRESGFGRDNSLHALDKYTQLKSTWIQL
jgi:acyl-CoA reductase-like NAD-dependent aldehyde dehydrogenase